MEHIDLNSKLQTKEATNNIQDKNTTLNKHQDLKLNPNATIKYLNLLSKWNYDLPENLKLSINNLNTNLSANIQNPTQEVNYDEMQENLAKMQKLSIKIIDKDLKIQEKIAEELSNEGKMIRSREASAILDEKINNLPHTLKEGHPSGQALQKVILQSLTYLTDKDSMGAGLKKDLALKHIDISDEKLSTKEQALTWNVLESSVAYIQSNQKEVLKTLEHIDNTQTKDDKLGNSTAAAMTRYLRSALNEFPEDSTYLDIFKQKKEEREALDNDEINEQITQRIKTIIKKAAETARRGNLIKNKDDLNEAELKKEMPNTPQKEHVDFKENQKENERVINSNNTNNTRELSLSELSARAARLQQQFREERQRLAKEGKLPNPADMPENIPSLSAKDILDATLSKKSLSEIVMESKEGIKANIQNQADIDENLENLDKLKESVKNVSEMLKQKMTQDNGTDTVNNAKTNIEDNSLTYKIKPQVNNNTEAQKPLSRSLQDLSESYFDVLNIKVNFNVTKEVANNTLDENNIELAKQALISSAKEQLIDENEPKIQSPTNKKDNTKILDTVETTTQDKDNSCSSLSLEAEKPNLETSDRTNSLDKVISKTTKNADSSEIVDTNNQDTKNKVIDNKDLIKENLAKDNDNNLIKDRISNLNAKAASALYDTIENEEKIYKEEKALNKEYFVNADENIEIDDSSNETLDHNKNKVADDKLQDKNLKESHKNLSDNKTQDTKEPSVDESIDEDNSLEKVTDKIINNKEDKVPEDLEDKRVTDKVNEKLSENKISNKENDNEAIDDIDDQEIIIQKLNKTSDDILDDEANNNDNPIDEENNYWTTVTNNSQDNSDTIDEEIIIKTQDGNTIKTISKENSTDSQETEDINNNRLYQSLENNLTTDATNNLDNNIDETLEGANTIGQNPFINEEQGSNLNSSLNKTDLSNSSNLQTNNKDIANQKLYQHLANNSESSSDLTDTQEIENTQKLANDKALETKNAVQNSDNNLDEGTQNKLSSAELMGFKATDGDDDDFASEFKFAKDSLNTNSELDELEDHQINPMPTTKDNKSISTNNTDDNIENNSTKENATENKGLLSRFFSLFSSKEDMAKNEITDNKSITPNSAAVITNDETVTKSSQTTIQNNAPTFVNNSKPLVNNSFDTMLYNLSSLIYNADLNDEAKAMGYKLIDEFKNPMSDLPTAQNFLNFVTGPLSPNSSQAVALHQWAFLLLCIKFNQLGKNVDEFLEKNLKNAKGLLDKDISLAKSNTEVSDDSTTKLLQESLGQIERVQNMIAMQGRGSYIPIPPNYEGGREGGFNVSRDEDEDGKKVWHLKFFFDLKDLGNIEIRAKAKLPEIMLSFVASNQKALQKINEYLPILREKLQEIGVTTRESSVRVGQVDFIKDTENKDTEHKRDDENSTLHIDV